MTNTANQSLDFTNYNYYLTANGNVVCVGTNGYSVSYENEESDSYTNSPFKIKSAKELGWVELKSANDFPKWYINV
jgi:hypothetical protein